MNFSTRYYAALVLREHMSDGQPREFVRTPLLAPGAVFRVDFAELLGNACAESLDMQLLLYRRTNDGVIPIGQDPGEAVGPTPIVAGRIDNVPGPCGASQPVGIYTVVNWESAEGTARVKIAQDSEVDAIIRASGRFPNADAAWEIAGVDPALAAVPPPAAMSKDKVAGRVVEMNGNGVAGIGVLIRTRYRVRLNDTDATNDPDHGYSDAIDYRITDATGSFGFERPAGQYQLEFFSADYAFAPVTVEVESPIESVAILAQRL
jgi:hypothetical protein